MLTLITPPAEEPVALADAKLFLRGPNDAEDAIVSGLITAARLRCETEIWRTFVTTTWQLTLDGFPGYYFRPINGLYVDSLRYFERLPQGPLYAIRLPRPSLVSVTSITYVDTAGNTQTLDPSQYQVETGAPGRIVPAYGKAWPSTRLQPGAVAIRYVAGYGDAAAVPKTIWTAILMLVTALYENRGDADAELPSAVKALLASEDWGGYE